MADLTKPPRKPICKEPDGESPCQYGDRCPASRQLLHAGYRKSLDQWVRDKDWEPLRGPACWAYGTTAARRLPTTEAAA